MLPMWLLDVLVEEEHDCKAGFVGVEPGAQKVMNIVFGCGMLCTIVAGEMFRGWKSSFSSWLI